MPTWLLSWNRAIQIQKYISYKAGSHQGCAYILAEPPCLLCIEVATIENEIVCVVQVYLQSSSFF